jgi:hypothetical protein
MTKEKSSDAQNKEELNVGSIIQIRILNMAKVLIKMRLEPFTSVNKQLKWEI